MTRRPILGLALLVVAGAGTVVAALAGLGWWISGAVTPAAPVTPEPPIYTGPRVVRIEVDR